eukprot:11180036-Lingulodinium_polyedra.AAC.1
MRSSGAPGGACIALSSGLHGIQSGPSWTQLIVTRLIVYCMPRARRRGRWRSGLALRAAPRPSLRACRLRTPCPPT